MKVKDNPTVASLRGRLVPPSARSFLYLSPIPLSLRYYQTPWPEIVDGFQEIRAGSRGPKSSGSSTGGIGDSPANTKIASVKAGFYRFTIEGMSCPCC
jgi:hypothetical protein